jgi:hypothetical protein
MNPFITSSSPSPTGSAPGPKRRRTTALRLAGAVTLATALGLAVVVPANADGGGGSDRQGQCSMRSNWELKASPDNGRILVELRVDTSHIGRVWTWSLTDNSTLVASGESRTDSSGQGRLEVQRRIDDQQGRDTIDVVAADTVTGETCAGEVALSGQGGGQQGGGQHGGGHHGGDA